MENVADATVGKTRCIAEMSKSLHLSQATKSKKTFNTFHNRACKRKFYIYFTVFALCKLLYKGKSEI